MRKLHLSVDMAITSLNAFRQKDRSCLMEFTLSTHIEILTVHRKAYKARFNTLTIINEDSTRAAVRYIHTVADWGLGYL